MQYISHYHSPIGDILLAADDIGLIGLWFEGQKYFALHLDKEHQEKDLPVFTETKRWLDIYFSGKEPDFTVPLHFMGTDFQKEVWEILCSIPYGKTMTYGDIAEKIACKRGLKHMSAQSWQPGAAYPECLHRQSVAQSATILSPFLCLATVSLDQMAA